MFNCLEYDDYDCAIKLFSEESFSVTPKDSLKEIFKISKEALGDFKVRVLQEWKTEIVEGTQPVSNYALLYDCEYTKNQARVFLSMGKTDGEIKIMGYRLVSPAFDK